MPRYNNFNEDELLDALTHSYQQYRELLMLGGSEEEFASIRLTLMAILGEFNKRRGFGQGEERNDFSFERNPDQ